MRLFALLALVVLRLGAAEPIELTLTDGRVVTGTVIEEDATRIVIEARMAGRKGGLTMRQTVPTEQVASRRALPSPTAEYQRLAAAVGTSAPEQLGLADWCREHGLVEEAAVHGKRCLAIDPSNDRARQLMASIGLHELDGAWLAEADYLAKTGKVRYGDRVVTPAEAAELEAADAASAEARKAEQAADDRASGITRLERRLKAIDGEIADLDKQKTAATAQQAEAKAGTAALDAAKAEVAAAEKASKAATGDAATTAARKRVADAEAKLAKARAAGAAAERKQTTATTTLARLEKKREALQAQRKEAEAELAKAKAEAAKAEAEAAKAAEGAKAKPGEAAKAKP